jgi:hypothetical protein
MDRKQPTHEGEYKSCSQYEASKIKITNPEKTGSLRICSSSDSEEEMVGSIGF